MVMGILEENSAKTSGRRKLQQDLALILFRMTVYSSLAFVPENYLRKRLGFEERPDISRRMRQASHRLRHRGLVEIEPGSWRLRLTDKGKRFAEKIETAERLVISPPKKWDEKWRVIIFDVPERYKVSRDRFRRILAKAGFLRLQDSVWVHPYDCEDLVALIRKELRLGGSVLYIIAEGLEGESAVRARFNL